jgi:heme/copper-type cytochrome/quinol oxidase subunit 3
MARVGTVDVSELPREGFGVASPAWWGTIGFMFIEGSSLVLCAFAYAYLSRRSPTWPPPGIAPLRLGVGTLVAASFVLSLAPAVLLHRAAKSLDRATVLVMLLIGASAEAIIVGLRGYELHALLPMRWDGSAYGSAVWFTMGVHTTLLVMDLGETLVFAALFLFGSVEKRHYADVADSVLYWFFVVLIWLPLYFMFYVAPRYL